MRREQPNIMLKLKKITKNNNVISCELFPEDSEKAGFLHYDVKNDKVIEFAMPKGYEWCETYIAQALQFFRNAEKSKLPNEKVLIWF